MTLFRFPSGAALILAILALPVAGDISSASELSIQRQHASRTGSGLREYDDAMTARHGFHSLKKMLRGCRSFISLRLPISRGALVKADRLCQLLLREVSERSGGS
jgi:hypothetical protein